MIKKLLIILLFFLACQSQEKADSTENKSDSLMLDSIKEEQFADYTIIPEYEPDFPLNDESRFADADSFGINISPTGDYTLVKANIQLQKEKLKTKYIAATSQAEKDKIIDEAGKYICEALVNQLIPFWYGMPWSLSGYSEIPNEGEVGCSYFVSNTLKHCGFKVNRYHLAQQNTKNIARSIQLNDSILIIKGLGNINSIKEYFLQNKKEGLYYVGLDSHVGYLLFKLNELFFIQSNYAYPAVVLTEFAEKSDVFSSNYYYIADISRNNSLLKKWLLSEEITVVKK